MKTIIVVAGATGNLGGRIIKSLLERGAEVRAIVRPGTEGDKLAKLEQPGITVFPIDLSDIPGLTEVCRGASCVVSALQGLRDVIVDAQTSLLKAAVAAGVPRFIPSDYSSDFTKLRTGDNRNFDFRREFNEILDKAPIRATSIFNGAFAEMLSYNIPFLNFKDKKTGYLESPDLKVDFTTMDNTAAFTAAAAMDPDAPRILRIASFQLSADEMAAVAEELTGTPFVKVKMGSRDELAAKIKHDRAEHPETENDIYPEWQRAQYMHSMFSVQMSPLDNNRYPGIAWTGVRDVIGRR